MADHGIESACVYENPGRSVLDRENPILFIKGVNEKHPMLESDRAVSCLDLQDAFSDLIDGKQSTELFSGLEPGRRRTVIWYQNWDTQDPMLEYETTGSAWDIMAFTPTGNVYDLEEE